MGSPNTKSVYVTPTLAEHGKVIARTEGGIRAPNEADMTPGRF